MKRAPILIALSLALTISAATALAQEGSLAHILTKIQDSSSRNEAALPALVYLADSVTEIFTSDGKLEKRIESTRRVTRHANDIKMDYLSMSINGKPLTKAEMNAELAKSKEGKQGKSPFLPEEMPKYQFEMAGETSLNGTPVWIIAFKPKTPSEELAIGKGYIARQDHALARLEFSPSRISSVVQHMNAVINFSLHDGVSLPADLTMDLHIKIAFIITLADQEIKIKEQYYGWEL